MNGRMNGKIINSIKGLNEKDLKYLYGRYCDMAFAFYIDSKMDKYERAMNVINLIDETLRERGVWESAIKFKK